MERPASSRIFSFSFLKDSREPHFSLSLFFWRINKSYEILILQPCKIWRHISSRNTRLKSKNFKRIGLFQTSYFARTRPRLKLNDETPKLVHLSRFTSAKKVFFTSINARFNFEQLVFNLIFLQIIVAFLIRTRCSLLDTHASNLRLQRITYTQ